MEEKSKFQKFVMEQWNRCDFNFATYNPRFIDKGNADNLGSGLKHYGLVEALIVNRKTKNLVGGHQRISKLDEFHKGINYSLDVCVIDVSEKEEVEINILLNNPRAMGDYDIEKMNSLLGAMPDIDFKHACIYDEDLQLFGITEDLKSLDSAVVNDTISQFEAVKSEKKAAITPEMQAQRKAEVKDAKSYQTQNKVDTYVTISFSSEEAKHKFMDYCGQGVDQLYIKGEIFCKNFLNLEV